VEPKHRVVDKLSCGDRLKFGFALADELEWQSNGKKNHKSKVLEVYVEVASSH
jgi:hypothetical protein